jgi:PAS domain S-box-containing protein
MGTPPVPRPPWHRRPLLLAGTGLAATLAVYALGRGHLALGLGFAVAAVGAAVWAARRRAPLAVIAGDLERAVHETQAVSAALRDSEHRYRVLADSVHDVISVLDLDLTLTYVSPSVTQLRGYTVEEVLAQRVEERICPGSLPDVRRIVGAELATDAGAPISEHLLEVEVPCKDGSTAWVETKASFIRDESGRPTSILTVGRDVTKRRRAETRTRALVEASRRRARSLDPDEVGRVVADGALQLLGARAAAIYLMEPDGDFALSAAAPEPGAGWRARLRADTSLAGRSVREGHPLGSADLVGEPRLADSDESRALEPSARERALVVLPLVARERALGVIEVRGPGGRRFPDEDVAVAQTFADQAAVVLENARLHRATERQLSDSQTLLAVSEAVSSSLDVTEAFRRATRAVIRALGADTGVTWRIDDEGAVLIPLAGYHVPRALLEPDAPVTLPLSHPLVRELAGEAPLWCADSAADVRFRDMPWLEALSHKSVLLIPLRGGGRLLGAVSVTWTARAHVLTAEDRRLVEAIARQIAIGIDNLRLVEELCSRQARLETLLEVNRQLSTIQPVGSLLARIAEGCGHVLGTTAAGFRLVEGDELSLAGAWGDAAALMPQPRLSIAASLSGRVVTTGEPIVAPDVQREPGLTGPGNAAARAAGYQSWLGVPVRIGPRVIGVLTIWKRRVNGFTPEDVATAAAFAAQAATALENARLYQEVSGAYEELSSTQAQLVQSQKMEAIGRLGGGVAHDFNNLLTIVAGRAEILNVKLGADDALRRHVDLIKKTVERAAMVTRQLLAFSRRQLLNPQTADLNDLVARMGAMLGALIGEDVELHTELAPGVGAVHVDPGQMDQVVMNLVVNARDAMPKGGRLTLTTSALTTTTALTAAAGEAPPGDWTVLAVTDTGSGMAPATLSHIFEPFFTTKPAGQGTGLGLATVYGIVKQSGGHVLVDSVVGHGTTFRILLPRVERRSAKGGDTEARPASAPGGSETILLAEDEQEVRDLVGELLSGLGYRVLTAANGAEAVAVCQRHPGRIDLMLSDVIMPGMSGPDAAARLRTLRPEMKVLYVSGYTDNAIARHGRFEPGVSLLLKPFDPAELARAVRRRLDGVTTAR